MSKYDEVKAELTAKGYEISNYSEEKDYPVTGKYTAYYAVLSKDGKEVYKDWSREGYEDALFVAYTMMKWMEMV